ncbi:MAG: hypothetical protein M1511_07440 [Deltaproteobacteria bacterium]|nr:hypothetical protein [Deltaproteobacteria bacterium]
MKIKNLFKASLDVVQEIHPFILQQRFLNLPEDDQKLILSVAAVLMMARPDMADLALDRSVDFDNEDIPEC